MRPTHWLICAQVGRGEVVPALEEGVLGVREGGVRQIIFPPELGVEACVEINQ